MADTEKAAAAGVNVTERALGNEEANSSASQSQTDEKRSIGSKVDDWYLWEIGGVILSAACIMTIVGLLLWLDGKKLPHWGFTTPEKVIKGKIIPAKTINISLNSVISWISTVGKIAILIPVTKGLGQLKWVWFAEQERRLDDLEKFDSATRGLTGSAKLLWRLKGQHFATVGAIAVILALGFDPFIQNLVHYDTVYIDDPTQQNFIVSTPVFDYSGTFGQLDPTTKGSIASGLYSLNPPSFRVPFYTCDTGNCTWSGYPTLAVGVHCTDLTSQLTQNCSTGQEADSVFGAACDWSLPNGVHLGADGRTVLAMNTSRDAIHYTNYTNPLAVIQTIAAFNTDYVNASAEVSALECVMFPSVKTYFSAVGQWYSADWNANHTDDQSNPVGPLGTADVYFESMVDQYEKYTYVPADNNSITAGYFLNPPLKAGQNISTGFASEYRMSNQAVVSLQSYLKLLLQGFVRTNATTEAVTTIAELNGGGSSDALSIIYDPSTGFSGCTYVANYWGTFSGSSTNVQCALDSISTGLTVMMRDAQNVTVVPGADAVSLFGFAGGNTIAPITQINVTWYWIVLPIVIWICSIAMLIGTAVKSKKARVHLWRTNPLAMVFLTLGRDERHEGTQHGGLSEDGLIKRAEHLRVRLMVEDGKDIMLKKPSSPV